MRYPMTSLAIYEPNPATEFQPILPLYQAIDGHHAGITPHEGFRLFNALTQLLAEYHDARSEIDSLHLVVMGKRHSQAFRYFTDGCNNSIGTTLAVDCLFDLQRATCALDESFWQKVL
ncbi:methylase, partial [Providencia rettgeri]